jgi:hypothetical protein
MELYEVETTRWYYSAILYRVVANDQQDAMQRASAGKLRDGVLEISASDPAWNGEEEYLKATRVETAHDMNIEDVDFPRNVGYDHTNCQYLGSNMWDCGHTDLQDVNEAEWVQLPLIDGHETLLDKPKSWNMWFEKWADALDGDAYAEAWGQYEASGGKW